VSPAPTNAARPTGLEVVEVRSLAEAISAAFLPLMRSGAFIKEAEASVT
jgi:hypothetical protein